MIRSTALVALIVMMLGTAAAAATLSLDVRDADIVDVIRLLATQSGRNVIADGSLRHDKITLRLRDVTFDQALAALTRAYDLHVRREGSVLTLGTALSMNRRFGDRGEALSTRTVVFALRNARPDELVKPLIEALVPGTIVVADRRTASLVVTGGDATIERARALIASLDAPAASLASAKATQALPLRYVKASDALKLLRGFVPEGTAVADDRQNAIVTSGTGEAIETVRSFLSQIDKAERQVMFEVRVIDLEPQNDQSNVGFEFGGLDFTGQPLAGASTYAFARNSVAINARLHFLISSGRAQILATPRLVTMNNREANLLIGQTYPIVYFDIRSGNQQVQNIDIGVKLRMTPTIGSDGSITAELHPEYSAIQSFVQNFPVLANRRLDSTLRVQDGETIVLGGLLREAESETVTRVPGLSRVPLIGEVFKNRQRSRVRDEVVFLITPHIIPAAEAQAR